MSAASDALTTDLVERTQAFISLVEEEQSPIRNSLSDESKLRDAYNELRNIARALDQYARTNRSLRYVGLMGTFSSGKSSIINSLIGQTVRAADLPPIDDEITILTHPSNRDALMGAHSRGLLKVTTQPVEAELLKSYFLVDTPGSGDPEVREGMVKDFLPICDLILYVFSATSALSVPDLSILKVLQDHLGFVPIRFVITRSDEFRKDHAAPFTVTNLDQDRRNHFLAQLIARMRTQAPNLDLAPKNFFFVDNRAKFGIEQLKHAILHELDSDVQLHSKKIAYFRRGISAQKSIFEDYLSTLIENVSQLESKAKLNRENYENKVVLSFQSINEFWRPREGAQTTRASTFAKLVDAWEDAQARDSIDFTSKWLALPKIQMLIEQKAKEFADDLRRQIVDIGNTELRQRREELDAQLPGLIRQATPIDPISVRRDHRIQIVRSLAPNIARSLKFIVETARGELLNEAREAIRGDKSSFDGLFDHARRGDIIAKDTEYYHDFEQIIRANLQEFLPIVALFKSAVTSAHARNLIARTGLGEKLDVLDNVDVDTAAAYHHTEMFLKNVFATRDSRRRALSASTTGLLERKDLVDASLEQLRVRTNDKAYAGFDFAETNALEIEADRFLNVVLDQVMIAVQDEINSAYAVWNDTLKHAHANFVANLHTNRSQFLRGWFNRFSGIVGIAGFLGLLAIIGLFATGLQGQLGWALTILSGALTTVTASVFGWGWKRFLSPAGGALPKSRWRIATEVVATSTPRLDPINIERSVDLEKAITKAREQFGSTALVFLSTDRDKLLAEYNSIEEDERKLIETEANDVNRYMLDWAGLATAMNEWYGPDEAKRKLISEAASAIKQRAIEPALTLFAERLDDVRRFAQRLRELAFS